MGKYLPERLQIDARELCEAGDERAALLMEEAVRALSAAYTKITEMRRAAKACLDATPKTREDAADEKCEWCGLEHPGQKCPLVKSLEFYPGGTVKHVEFNAPDCFAQSPQTWVVG